MKSRMISIRFPLPDYDYLRNTAEQKGISISLRLRQMVQNEISSTKSLEQKYPWLKKIKK